VPLRCSFSREDEPRRPRDGRSWLPDFGAAQKFAREIGSVSALPAGKNALVKGLGDLPPCSSNEQKKKQLFWLFLGCPVFSSLPRLNPQCMNSAAASKR